jgi:hypothetical protein
MNDFAGTVIHSDQTDHSVDIVIRSSETDDSAGIVIRSSEMNDSAGIPITNEITRPELEWLQLNQNRIRTESGPKLGQNDDENEGHQMKKVKSKGKS